MREKPLDQLRVGDDAFVEWPAQGRVRVTVSRVSPRMIGTSDGRRWDRKTGLPVPRRLYQGQRLRTGDGHA